ncbi:MAG: MBL fold metallo-hydrolase [Dehalococcoidia bacterium]
MSRIEFVPGIQIPNVNWWQTENSWCSNSYLALQGRTLYIIDPGLGGLHRTQLLEATTRFSEAETVYLLNTHWHLDHSGNGVIIEELWPRFPEVHYCIPEVAKGDMQRFMESPAVSIEVDMGLQKAQWLGEADGEEFDFGGVPFGGWRVGAAHLLSTPGHSPDSLSIYLKGEKAVFPGDLVWYVNPNQMEGSIDSLLQSIAKLKALVTVEGIDYLGGGHFLPLEGEQKIIDYISDYEEKERALLSRLEEVVAGKDRVSVDHCLERLRESDHPAIKEALRINFPYFTSWLHRFTQVFLREKGWHEVEKGTWRLSV